MGVSWTKEQQQVIDARGEDLLVSAAAGSGKTAVLIEHIIGLLMDEKQPANVSDLLVVTFTRAAASEMKDRLRVKLTELLEQDPENEHLRRQIPLLGQARISTIDSFCQWLVRSYFHKLDIDPDFRVVDEGEDRLLREDVLDLVLDAAYEEDAGDFRHLLDAFGSDKGDKPVREMILRLYNFADSAAWPRQWLEEQKEKCRKGDLDEAIHICAARIRQQLEYLADLAEEAIEEADGAEGLDPYRNMFVSDLKDMEKVLRAEDDRELLTNLASLKFMRKPVVKKHSDEMLKNRLSALRDRIKKQADNLKKRYACDPEDEAERMNKTIADRICLINLTLSFSRSYSREKMRRNLLNFADVEHLALSLLVSEEETAGEHKPTELARQLGETFREIIVDEYQDSNLVQETLLLALSGKSRGIGNMFMVGDVKQSIYKFRMARPELFMAKYDLFRDQSGEGPGRKIDLGRNFRSRKSVLAATNQVFGQLMHKTLGGVEYDERAALYPGAEYPPEDPEAELLVADLKEAESEKIETEALMTAARIRELMDPEKGMKVWDAKDGKYRNLRYSDIVILLRTLDGWADTFAKTLNQEGIPAYAQLKKGYFASQEVKVLLSFLKVLDNPLQDIPLAAVLLSPLFGFTEEELAMMVQGLPDGSFYDRLQQGAALGRCEEKWDKFTEVFDRYRQLSSRPIHETLTEILRETDYSRILAAQPNGKIRCANTEMLISQAMAFEDTSYHGIFQFTRYMDQLQRYQIDFGEAQVLSENEDLVRITSIHKSKGLEFPVVFVSGCGKLFNVRDAANSMLIHEDLGLACDYFDTVKRVKYSTLWKRLTAERMVEDIQGEELRVLYVAMTRAKEKLIMTACIDSSDKKAKEDDGIEPGEELSSWQIASSHNYLSWLLMAEKSLGREIFVHRTMEPDEIMADSLGKALEDTRARDHWKSLLTAKAEDQAEYDRFKALFDYSYPYQAVTSQKGAYSVSELKHKDMDSFDEIHGRSRNNIDRKKEQADLDGAKPVEDAKEKPERTQIQIQMPMQEGSALPQGDPGKNLEYAVKKQPGDVNFGAIRGSAYHSALEYIPAIDGGDPAKIKAHLGAMVDQGKLSEEELKMIRTNKLLTYYQSYLGKLAARAEAEGRMFKEQPFVMSLPLREVTDQEMKDQIPEDEWVLVQGIIDAFAMTDQGLILWDYKTDSVPREGGEEILLGYYSGQLKQYKRALERAYGLKVLEVWIYSFALDKEILV